MARSDTQPDIQPDAAPPLRSTPSAPPLFSLMLYPHRSLPKRLFQRLIGLLAIVCVLASVRFILIGAWPVVVFVAIDIAALWLAFYLNYRSGRLYETLQLTRHDLIVTRVHPGGETESWRFEPYWLRVQVETLDETRNQLVLTSHGKRLVIGAFLSADERRSVATGLTHALSKVRA